jgi:hypothetical protein
MTDEIWKEYLNINEYHMTEYDKIIMELVNKGESNEKKSMD